MERSAAEVASIVPFCHKIPNSPSRHRFFSSFLRSFIPIGGHDLSVMVQLCRLSHPFYRSSRAASITLTNKHNTLVLGKELHRVLAFTNRNLLCMRSRTFGFYRVRLCRLGVFPIFYTRDRIGAEAGTATFHASPNLPCRTISNPQNALRDL